MGKRLKLGEESYALSLQRAESGYLLKLGDEQHRVSLKPKGEHCFDLVVNDQSQRVWLTWSGNQLFVHIGGRNSMLEIEDLSGPSGGTGAAGSNQLSAPMPGTVISLSVAEGDKVAKGQVLMVIESMKMETSIKAIEDSQVERIHYSSGETFERNALLISLLSPEAEEA